jgi:tyrosyl-tRNA synthetase
MRLRRFQELGHTPIFLVGDFTARIGDPSGRKKTRPALTVEEVQRNAATYVDQVSVLLDVTRIEVRFNSEWMDTLPSSEWVRLCATSTVARLLERDDFSKRFAANEPISVHEFLYPFVQAYDSVALRADVELGGTDQTFNLLMGREVQRAYGQPPQAVIIHPLLVGTDGREKMSKSLGNTIGVTEPGEEIFGKVMRISDELMFEYVERLHCGEWPDVLEEAARVAAGAADRLGLKEHLASRVVERLCGADAASRAAEHFRRVVRNKELPLEIPEVAVAADDEAGAGILDVLRMAGLTASNSESRRLVSQGAVQVEGEAIRDDRLRLTAGTYLLRAGRRRFARVTVTCPAGDS